MSNVGQRERATQDRLVQFFQQELGYRYPGNWEYRGNNRHIELELLTFKTADQAGEGGMSTQSTICPNLSSDRFAGDGNV